MPLSYKHRTYNRENEISAAALNRSFTKFIYLQTSPRGLDNSQSKLHYELHKKITLIHTIIILFSKVTVLALIIFSRVPKGDSVPGSNGVHN